VKPIVLVILDGVGIREEVHGNAFAQAYKPVYNYLVKEYPHSLLKASGKAVGLPNNQMGNSEVGHLNIGAGRIVYQPLQVINDAVENGEIYNNNTMLEVINHVKENNSKLHVLGLLSDGGVHSHIDHILAMLELSKRHNVKNLYLHIFTDGRDTLPNNAYEYIKALEDKIKEYNNAKIATISGRYYAMDRDNRWDRTKKAYNAMIYAIGNKNTNLKDLIEQSYNEGIYDEFIEPHVIDKNGIIENNDGIIFANFRPDRATQILTAITNPVFKNFDTKILTNLKLVSLMPCAKSVIGESIYKIDELKNTLGVYLSERAFSQLRIAETEKYAHVTYFFDGGKERVLDGCKRIMINSPLVATYDLKPEMSVYEVTSSLINELESNKYDFILVNYANPDMVGHTGNIEATIKAIEAIDENLGLVYNKVKQKQGLLIITADHGNCEHMLDKNNNIFTSHTTNKVPFIICNKEYKVKNGKLGDISPTILSIMKVDIPEEMTGDILIN
jgi:2,3-bisphosphoglycerate-independent phosphoglycerate mutase